MLGDGGVAAPFLAHVMTEVPRKGPGRGVVCGWPSSGSRYGYRQRLAGASNPRYASAMISDLRTYSVQAASRRPLLNFMLAGLADAGCRLLYNSSPDRAPFILTFEAPNGERFGVVAYAFLANRTPTKNRPPDERSFQIKYGSKSDLGSENLHPIWQDPMGLFTTLFLGIDVEEGFFVAADPERHNPTRFFIRLEFKDAHAEATKQREWYAWSRSRATSAPDGHPEVLVGGLRRRFFDLVRFEREAGGLSPQRRTSLAKTYAP